MARVSVRRRAQNALRVLIQRLSKGRVGGTMSGVPVLVLLHEGRRTGRRLATPLMFARDGEDFVVVASNGGKSSHPNWYLNLRAHPEAQVEIRGRRYTVRAEEVPAGEERERLWWMMVELYPNYNDYRRKTKRVIPVVRLRPVAGADGLRENDPQRETAQLGSGLFRS